MPDRGRCLALALSALPPHPQFEVWAVLPLVLVLVVAVKQQALKQVVLRQRLQSIAFGLLLAMQRL